MAFCTSKTTRLETPADVSTLIKRLQAKGYEQDGGAGWMTGGWTRWVLGIHTQDYAREETSITAPGARWIQIDWRDEGDGSRIRVHYHVTGLTRDYRKEQHTKDLCPKIQVKVYRQGPKQEHPSWMAEWGMS